MTPPAWGGAAAPPRDAGAGRRRRRGPPTPRGESRERGAKMAAGGLCAR